MTTRPTNPKDTVTIAPGVLLTIVRAAALSVEGVMDTASAPTMDRWFRRTSSDDGISVEVNQGSVKVEVYLVANGSYTLHETSAKVQHEIARTIKEYAGMTVSSVNVHIEDIQFKNS